MDLSLAAVAWRLALAAVLLVIAKTLWNVRRSPLSTIPNASPIAPLSRLAWAFPRAHAGYITLDLPRLHEKLGPLVRISPDEVSFYSLSIYDTIHKVGSPFKKDPRNYGEFVQDGHPALFTITDPVEHGRRRRLMGQLFNRSKMDNLEGLFVHHIAEMVKAIRQRDGRPFDVMPASRALEADIISQFSFGETIGAIDAWSKGGVLGMVAANDTKATWMPVMLDFPVLCDFWDSVQDWTDRLFGYRTPYARQLNNFDKWSQSSWEKAIAPDKAKETASPSSFPNLVQTLIRSGLHPQTALSEAKENLGPGTDTTSASLAHILWALAHNSRFQDALYEDLAAVGFSTDMTTLEGIPRLKACLKEGVRWTGAAAAMLPRVVPPGGFEFDGHYLPEGTVLTSSPIWYLADKTAFPNPYVYDPYRWLTPDATAISEDALRDRYYIPFSKGANICMGAHFSYYELYVSISQIVRHFRLERHTAITSYSYPLSSKSTNDWNLVKLPKRKEWVAAVPTEPLLVNAIPRSS